MIRNIARAALIASVAATFSAPAGATHAWNNYHWARTGTDVSAPLSLKVNLAITSAWTTSVNGAFNDWNGRSVLRLGTPIASSANARRCSPITGQILVCNYSYGPRGWLGLASINIDSSNHITTGTTKLNDSYFNTATYDKPEWRALVACQEIGHDFGLGHQDETFDNVNVGSCMDYTNAPLGGIVGGFDYGPNNMHPNTHDTQELNIIYGHTDSYMTTSAATNFGIRQVGQAGAAEPAAPGDTAREWGTAIHRDGKGRPDLFVRPLPGGGKMLTHVFWALEAKGTEAQ